MNAFLTAILSLFSALLLVAASLFFAENMPLELARRLLS